MRSLPRMRWRRKTPKRVMRAATWTRYDVAFRDAAKRGKLTKKHTSTRIGLELGKKKLLARYKNHLPALHRFLDFRLHQLGDHIIRHAWISTKKNDPKNEAERERIADAKNKIGAFLYNTTSLEAKLYALSRLHSILRAARPLLHAHHPEMQERMIRQLERLEATLRQTEFEA